MPLELIEPWVAWSPSLHEPRTSQNHNLLPKALYPGKDNFSPSLAELVCNLALNFYGDLILFLVYFRFIKLAKWIEDVWAQKELLFQKQKKTGQNYTLDFWTDFSGQMTSKLHETCLLEEYFLNLRMSWFNPSRCKEGLGNQVHKIGYVQGRGDQLMSNKSGICRDEVTN